MPYVSSFDFFIDTTTFSRDLVPYEMEEQKTFFLKGVNNPEIIDIKEGVIQLIQGRTFTDEEVNLLNDYRSVTLISKNLAETNDLNIGSMISIESNVYGDGVGGQLLYEHLFASRIYELEVVGIFELEVDIDLGEEWMDEGAMALIENRIYVPGPVAEDHVLFNNEQHDLMTGDEPYILDNRINLSNIFVLEDPLEMQHFREAVIKIIPDSEWYLVEDLSNTYRVLSHSMDTMEWLASRVTRISIGLGILIFIC